jgi:hypothetical protein
MLQKFHIICMITRGLGFCDSPFAIANCPIYLSIYLSEAGFHQPSNHPQEELAKFGYRRRCKNYFLKTWRIWHFFFPKILCIMLLVLATVHKFSLSKALI